MAPTTRAAILLLLPSLTTGGGGLWLVRHARAIPAPDRERPRAVPGKVVEMRATPCFRRGGQPTRTCFRSVVRYEDGGQAREVASRSVYHPARHAKGQAVEVLLKPDGTAFIDLEWESRQADLERDFASARDFPLWMGFLLAGCGAFGLLLAAGLAFWVDRSPTS